MNSDYSIQDGLALNKYFRSRPEKCFSLSPTSFLDHRDRSWLREEKKDIFEKKKNNPLGLFPLADTWNAFKLLFCCYALMALLKMRRKQLTSVLTGKKIQGKEEW